MAILCGQIYQCTANNSSFRPKLACSDIAKEAINNMQHPSMQVRQCFVYSCQMCLASGVSFLQVSVLCCCPTSLLFLKIKNVNNARTLAYILTHLVIHCGKPLISPKSNKAVSKSRPPLPRPHHRAWVSGEVSAIWTEFTWFLAWHRPRS